MERCVAGIALAVLSPAIAGTMLTVRLLSGRSPLIALRRIGLHGEPFWLFKVRTMWKGNTSGWIEYLEETEIPKFKTEPDPRVTSQFAKLCRRFSLDELPQLIHVLQGKMRLAGPRPLTQLELELYYGEAANEVLSVLPGITGLWQVRGRNNLTYKQRRRLDQFFVRKRGLSLYLWILLKTPRSILRADGAY